MALKRSKCSKCGTRKTAGHENPTISTQPVELANFLGSEMLTIGVTGQEARFKIHAALFENRLPALFDLWKHEKQEVYECEDTELPVLRNVLQWMYTNNYNEDDDTNSAGRPMSEDNKDGPLHLHVGMYVFAHIYQIAELQKLALINVKESFTTLAKAEDVTQIGQVVRVLHDLFSKLHDTDPLLKDLALKVLKGSLNASDWNNWGGIEESFAFPT